MVRTRTSLIISLSLFINENTETNKITPKLYSIISCSCIQAIVCFEHSNSFQSKRGKSYAQSLKGTHKLFKCNNFNIRYWSWNYHGCWHQTCPPIHPRWRIYIKLIPVARPIKDLVSLFYVTTSTCWDWVIFLPATFLRCGSQFSGSFSRIET